MPKPIKLSEFDDIVSSLRRERRSLPSRVASNVTDMTPDAITEDTDPTQEIRNLIEQLQQTAREARTQLRVAEDEKDELAHQLEAALIQLDQLRANEREMRSQFVEVASLIRERDAALLAAERSEAIGNDAKKKLDGAAKDRNDAQRQRDEAARQRDELLRRVESLKASTDSAIAQAAEAQKQVVAIRQARDAAHSQNLELTNELGRAQDQVAEIGYERDAAQKFAKQTSAELSEYRRQLDTVTSDRDATARQVEQLTQELDSQRKRLLDASTQNSATLLEDERNSSALDEARVLIGTLTQERDNSRNRMIEQSKELEEIRVKFQTLADEKVKLSSDELAGAKEKFATLEAQSREARHEAANLKQQVLSLTEHLAFVESAQTTGTGAQFENVLKERDAALTSLQAAQKQIDRIIADRDASRAQSTERQIEMEAELNVLRARTAALEAVEQDAGANAAEIEKLNKRFEKQRVETIDITTQLQAAQREVRELSANLAEARLQAKFANAAAAAAKAGGDKMKELASELSLSEAEMNELPPMRPAPLAVGVEEPLSEREIKSAFGAMRHCFQSFTKTPEDLSLLNELYCHVHAFAERARVSGFIAVHRLSTALSEFTNGLYQNPGSVNPSTLRTLNQTIEFLASLMKEKKLPQLKDPAKALIYAVDDDIDNCESIRMAMETAMVRTQYAQEPGLALNELAGSRYDLIFLDVNLPGMDGFELCSHIRQLAIHQHTPIVFLTGLATLENRVQSSLSGGNDFIAKPFNLHELSVKALTHILRTQLATE